MKCTCDEIGESSCREHGYGLLECDCGMRFTAPLHVKSFMLIQCPACGQSYAGYEDFCNGMWKKITEQERKEGTDGPVYNAGRSEGHADVCAELRKIIDPKDKNHWNKDGLLKEVARLYGAYVPPPYLGVGRTGDCNCADDFTCAEHGGSHVLRDHK